MFTNESLFTIQAFTITRVHCNSSLSKFCLQFFGTLFGVHITVSPRYFRPFLTTKSKAKKYISRPKLKPFPVACSCRATFDRYGEDGLKGNVRRHSASDHAFNNSNHFTGFPTGRNIWKHIFKIFRSDKVHILWEGHIILRNLPLTFKYSTYVHSKVRGRCRKILWPSQNIWTLQPKE